ncbi:Bloom syndrome protein [Trichophyton interdigitale]|uniref:RecQ-like DNA helicase BLM n=1 Tax=Trichophyton interdigitale TaxID=101480 RepID=A0A9P4YKM3_9EURO|nr:Bloom syndrome protein [Trichophyton interdigitale]KAF3900812.1 Bloom syndrome protein [Trichophyton interdigitale]KAG8211731.1 Bloom syndrome protein [Trichophyton interdigitale]
MTKNNLKAHLAWLLERPNPLDDFVTPQVALDSQAALADSVNTEPTTHIEPEFGQRQSIALPIEEDPSVPRAVAPGNDDVSTDNTMAVLQLASPPPRNRLHSTLSAKSSIDVPGTPAERSSKKRPLYKTESETPKTRIKQRSLTSITPPTSSNSSRLTRKARIFSSVLKQEEIESVDLTKDAERNLSSSGSASTFGEPRRLWREDYASRSGPHSSSSEKKKRRKAPDSEDDSYPQKKHSSPSPITRQLKREKTQPEKAKAPVTQRVINDFEDDGIYLDMMEEDTFYPDLSQGKESTETSKKINERNTISKPKLDVSQSLSNPQPPKGTQVHPPHPSTPGNPLPSEGADSLITRYLNTPPASFRRIINTLNNDRTIKAKSAYDLILEGVDSQDKMKEVRILASRIKAMEELQELHADFSSSKKNHDRLKSALIASIEQMGDIPDSFKVAEIRESAQRLQEKEAKIISLIQESEMFKGQDFDIPTTNRDPFEKADQEPDSFSQIKSTVLPQASSSEDESRRHPPAISGPNDATSLSSNHSGGTRKNDIMRPPVPEPRWSQEFPSAPRNVKSPLSSWDPQFDDAEDFVDMLDDEPPYSRTMDAPCGLATTATAVDSDFDDRSASNPFDELEDFFDYPNSKPAPPAQAPAESHSQLPDREVFRETSGNQSKPPSVKHSGQKDVGQISSVEGHPWSKDVKSAMRETFKLRGFRPNQLEAINSTLSGKDTFVLMPTGGGKSLCYQLPSIIRTGKTKGVTIVISPLLSLMQDQVAHLQKLNVKAFLINGDVSKDERATIMNNLRSLRADSLIQLLYVTPEMLAKSRAMESVLLQLHSNDKLARIVIDEAHCVSQWGHDFRPDYTALGTMREKYPGVPVMALTATATPNVQVDVIHNLRMKGCEVFTQSFNRPNLTYEVRKKGRAQDALKDIADLITNDYPDKCGIIYCLSRKTCERVAMQLSSKFGVKAAHYHAGLSSKDRFTVQRDWQSGKHNVIVATIAFGMGIDKANVRFVIHHSIPQSLEGYYQETGRAGRDGKRSECYLYYAYYDSTSIGYMIKKNKETTYEQKQRQRQMLRHVTQFCENITDCRRAQILAYFDEKFKREDCNRACDNCKSDFTFEIRDFTQHAAAAVRLVENLESAKVTVLACVDVFRGYPRQSEFSQLPEFGYGSDLERGDVERLFRHLLYEDAIEEDNVPNQRGFAVQHIKLGRNAQRFKTGRQKTELPIRITPGKATTTRRVDTNFTGVRVARDDQPESTNVSSPIRGPSHLRIQDRRSRKVGTEDNEYDDDSDGFAPIRDARNPGSPSRSRHSQLGPRITDDGSRSGLSDLREMVLDDFLLRAKGKCEQIKMEKGLREQPFPDAILREMGIRLPSTLSELSRIRNIDPDKVERYGSKFLKLIARSKKYYEDIAGGREQGEDVHDPNHENVVTISSDDEMYGEWTEDELNYADDAQDHSPYFPDDTASSFKAKVSEYEFSNAESSRQPSHSKSNSAQHPKPRQTNSKRSRPPKAARASKPSGARFNKKSQNSRPAKKKSSPTTSRSRSSSKPAHTRGPSIGMMPT